MTYCSDLPPELWLEIASYLPSNDLAVLARVDKAQLAIAREHLYSTPQINRPDEGHHLMSFMRTLFANPQLFAKVRSLSIGIVHCTMPFNDKCATRNMYQYYKDRPSAKSDEPGSSPWCPQYHTVRKELLDRLEPHSDSDKHNLRHIPGIVDWSTAAFYGGLIEVLPNLDDLSVSCYLKTYDQPPHLDIQGRSGFVHSFFGLQMLKNVDAKDCSFMRLKKFRCMGGCFSARTLPLRNLQMLQIGPSSEMHLFPGVNPVPHFAGLELHLSSQDMLKYCNARFRLPCSKALLSKTKHARILFEDVDRTLCPQDLNSSTFPLDLFQRVVSHLEVSTTTLETLEIIPANIDRLLNDNIFSGMGSLTAFTRLAKLVFPFQNFRDELLTILPWSLQELSLLHQGPVWKSTLDDVIRHYTTRRNLRRLDLYCQRDDPVALADSTWKDFKLHSISVFVWAISGNMLLRGMPAE
ncbi:hypothetical protein CC86DRAFT_158546 [Ophiobolus disseminans]|uniref:F-box domain-containing protein n=1 Tax=Ophiobolus disseminans TaxID=1469910 RepID=A0A6A6ZCG4_9PLEO|nr:hypothetical protein CC86DRAFT_158546 [Ophiobolus disseminans]